MAARLCASWDYVAYTIYIKGVPNGSRGQQSAGWGVKLGLSYGGQHPPAKEGSPEPPGRSGRIGEKRARTGGSGADHLASGLVVHHVPLAPALGGVAASPLAEGDRRLPGALTRVSAVSLRGNPG